MEVKQIRVDDASHEVVVRGIPYARNRSVGGRLQFQTNELCQILEVIGGRNNRPAEEELQAMVTIRSSDVLRTREFHKTNTKYPACRFGNDPSWAQKTDKGHRQRSAPLTCRWKMRLEYLDASYQKKSKPYGEALLHLTENEIADARYRISDKERRNEHLGRDVEFDNRVPGPYRFGDAFSGAGGSSSGARMAGLEVRTHKCQLSNLPRT